MDVVKLFLEEVTAELLYNTVHNEDSVTHSKLYDEFKKKTGHEPMELFGFANQTGCEFSHFVDAIPGLKRNARSIECDDSDLGDTQSVYKMFNSTYVKETGAVKISVADYREQLLIKCCEIMKDDFANLSSCKDVNDNTPLHLVAALPGVGYGCETLVKYLLKAGVDPFAANNNGQTFLHVIFGRFQTEVDSADAVCFTNERATTPKWFVEDRKALLKLVCEELSQAQISSLAKAQDIYGNTVLHECALSTTLQQELIQELKICTKLLELDAGLSLRIPNVNGEVPLHYAYNASIFVIFLHTETAVCRARNDRDETPVLFILKQSVGFAFSETSASAEIANLGFVKTGNRNISKAVKLVENLTNIVSDCVEARETVFIPDINGNVAIDVALIAIRTGSYGLDTAPSTRMADLRSSLVELLSKMLCDASASDMKRQNKMGQSFLHVLLDMGEDNEHKIIKEAYILQSIDILLTHLVDVNAVDSEGRTPLDIVLAHSDKGPALYEKCADLLIQNGAVLKCDMENGRSLVSREMSSFTVGNQTRKLRACPKRHLSSAERLVDPNTQVSVVGKYRYFNQDPVGSGAFSTIFVAIKDENFDSRSGAIECRAYALKRLDKAKINPKEIQREITTLLSISGKCENIIKYYDSDEDDFFQYLCLDLMDGDLHEFVENEDVNSVLKGDPAIQVRIAEQIINGLSFLHEQKFIHRDIKPGNILYTADPSLHFKIADFGLTKNVSTFSTMISTRGNGVGMTPGTRCWMAPELISMQSTEHTQQSDIFSLGLVLHYLFTLGKHPFAIRREERPHVIERNMEENQVHLDTTLHPELASFLQVILTKDYTRRPPASYLHQHPFLWSDSKKNEFLKAVGEQPEAVSPSTHSNNALETQLQKTRTGQEVRINPWDQAIRRLFRETMEAWKQKKYRTGKVIDLIRFIRNSYAHKQERTFAFQHDIDSNIFLRKFPSLVLDVFFVVQQLGFERRSNIRQALSL
jgi:serine/threonine protein kinase